MVEGTRCDERACHVGSHCTLDLSNLLDKEATYGTSLLQSESSHKGPSVGSLVPGTDGEQTFPHSP